VKEAARTCAGRDSSTFEQILQLLIVVLAETAYADALTIPLQLPTNVAILAALMRMDGETL
jgi:hypothetical protein